MAFGEDVLDEMGGNRTVKKTKSFLEKLQKQIGLWHSSLRNARQLRDTGKKMNTEDPVGAVL